MLAIHPVHFRRIVRASAIYDLIVTAPFATPWSFSAFHHQLSSLNLYLGGIALPPFGVFHILMACLFGSIVLIWSILRIADPQVRFGRFDAVGRLLFSTWMVWALIMTGTPLIWIFIIPEFVWGLIQILPTIASKRN
jgi:hypothetical protein